MATVVSRDHPLADYFESIGSGDQVVDVPSQMQPQREQNGGDVSWWSSTLQDVLDLVKAPIVLPLRDAAPLHGSLPVCPSVSNASARERRASVLAALCTGSCDSSAASALVAVIASASLATAEVVMRSSWSDPRDALAKLARELSNIESLQREFIRVIVETELIMRGYRLTSSATTAASHHSSISSRKVDARVMEYTERMRLALKLSANTVGQELEKAARGLVDAQDALCLSRTDRELLLEGLDSLHLPWQQASEEEDTELSAPILRAAIAGMRSSRAQFFECLWAIDWSENATGNIARVFACWSSLRRITSSVAAVLSTVDEAKKTLERVLEDYRHATSRRSEQKKPATRQKTGKAHRLHSLVVRLNNLLKGAIVKSQICLQELEKENDATLMERENPSNPHSSLATVSSELAWAQQTCAEIAAEWDNADTKETISQSFAKAEGQDSVTVTRNEGDSEIVEGSALTSGDQLALLQQRLVIQLQLDNVETSNGGEQVFEAPDDDSESNTGQTRQVLSREDRIRLRKQQLEEDEKRETAIDDARQLLLELRNVLSKRP